MSAPLDSELRAKHSVSCRTAVVVQQYIPHHSLLSESCCRSAPCQSGRMTR